MIEIYDENIEMICFLFYQSFISEVGEILKVLALENKK